MYYAILESVIGFTAFGLIVMAGRPLLRMFRQEPAPAFLRSSTVSEMIVLGYFVALIISFVVGLHGVL